jgi:hypothetical protein
MTLGQLFGQCLTPLTTVHSAKPKPCSDMIRPGADTRPVVAVFVVGIVIMLAVVAAVVTTLIGRAVRARRS